MALAALPPPRRLDWVHLIKDAALAALVALVLAIPLVGFQAIEVNAALTIRTRFDWVAIGVAAVFVGRLLLRVVQAVRPIHATKARRAWLMDRRWSKKFAWLCVAAPLTLPFLPPSSAHIVGPPTSAAIFAMSGLGPHPVGGPARPPESGLFRV